MKMTREEFYNKYYDLTLNKYDLDMLFNDLKLTIGCTFTSQYRDNQKYNYMLKSIISDRDIELIDLDANEQTIVEPLWFITRKIN